jgi:DNA-binding IclR family transcriptional regulator
MDTMSIPKVDAESKLSPTGSAKALVKGIALVDTVAASDSGLRLADLVDVSGLPRPTVLRLLEVLREHGLLSLDQSGGYSLGPRVAVWGQHYLDGLDVRTQAEDLMQALAAETRETCFLGVRDDLHVLYVAKVDSPQAVRPAARVGGRNPLHSTAIGKALLGFAPTDVARTYLSGPLERKTVNTITDPERLKAELARVRERGYSTDEIENEEGVRCVAAPVRDHRGSVVAAISVSAPAYRFGSDDLPRLAPRVISAAEELSRRIGHRAQAGRR